MKRNSKLIDEQELADWDLNAEFYANDAESPLVGIIAERRKDFYGFNAMREKRVLDLGAGTGSFTNGMHESNVIVSVDYAERMLGYHQMLNKHPAKFAVRARADALPFKNGSFDVIFADGVLHHLKAQGVLGEGMKETRRVLRAGGALFFFDRNGSFASTASLRMALFVKGIIPFKRRYPSSATRNEVPFGGRRDLEFIANCGFRVESVRYVASLPLFFSIVVANGIGYFLSKGISASIQNLLQPTLKRIDGFFSFRACSVEQCVKLRRL